MRELLLGLCVLAASVSLAPDDRAAADPFPQPPPEGAVRWAALGRLRAVADLLWLRSVQIIGHPRAEEARYPNLEGWADLTTRMDPAFDVPYYYASVLLTTDAARAARVDTLLTRGEQASPDAFFFPMHRGFLAYFGRFDAEAAAEHYKRASMKPGAPPYLAAFAQRLEGTSASCMAMQGALREMVASEEGSRSAALQHERLRLLEHCVRARVAAAAAAYRLKIGREGTYEELVTSGTLAEPLPAIPGVCWDTEDLSKVSVAPCHGGGAR